MEGKVVSHYEIVQEIGRGGMGVVYRARDTRLRRDVALKFLNTPAGRDLAAKERFMSEARAASALDHPNICTVFEADELDDGTLFIAMAYCEGRSLEERLRSPDFTVDEAVTIAKQIARGLAAAHRKGIVHRDLKPANVIITEEGVAKIVDFGLAKVPDQQLTRSGTTLGTVAYMSPEQIRAEKVDERLDIWALGVLLYQMLSGKLPFHAPYEQAMMYRILHEEPDPLAAELPPEHERLAAVIESCLEKDPAMRPGSMEEIIEWLETAGGQPDGDARFELRRRTGRFTPRRKRAYIGGGAIFAGIALLAALLLYSSPALPEEKLLVILPLASMTETEDDRLLCEGLTSVLSNRMAQMASFTDEAFWVVPHAEVRSRSVSSPSEARRSFGATLALDGSLVRSASGIRLSFDLIDASTLRTVRAMDFTVPDAQIERLQEETVQRVAGMLRVDLAAGSGAVLAAGRTGDAEAFSLYLRGRALLERFERRENVDSAIRYFQRAVTADDRFAMAYAALGEAYWRLYETSRDEINVPLAMRHLERALAIDHRLAEVHVTMARLYSGMDRIGEALESINRAIALEPANAEAYLVLARIQDQSGDVERAEASFQRAISLRPTYWAGYNALGGFYYRRGRYEDAEEQFRSVVALVPDNARGFSNLGAVYHHMNRPEESKEAFERSIAIAPSYGAHSNLASLYFYEGNMARAAENYEKALEIEDGHYSLWGYLETAYGRLGNREAERERALQEAIRRAERRIQLNPGDARARADLASFYLRKNEPEHAREILASVDDRVIDDLEVMYILAENHEMLGERRQAIDWLCRAVEGGYSLVQIEQTPTLVSLRQDRRFERVRRCAHTG